MNQADRERRHQTALSRIDRVQLIVGKGDRIRVDHEGTLLERARLLSEEIHSHRATEAGLVAFDRLLQRIEEHGPRQSRDVVAFLAALWGNQPLPLATLRGPGEAASDDMLAVLDAFRYARLSLVEHVAGGPQRVARVLAPSAERAL